MALHAKLSASGTKEWASCAGQLPLISLLPQSSRNDTNDFARLGTCGHFLLEHCLRTGTQPEQFEDRIIRIVHEGTDKEKCEMLKPGARLVNKPGIYQTIVDQDMHEAVDEAVTYIKRRLAELFDGDDCTKSAIERGQLRLEQRLTILTHRDDSFGTGDVVIDAWPQELEIFDYKHGANVPVEIFDPELEAANPEMGGMNLQLRSYALGSAELHGWDYALYRFTIGQPRAAHSGGRIRSGESTPEQLRAFKEWLSNRASQVDQAFELLHEVGSDVPDFKAGAIDAVHTLDSKGFMTAGSHCYYCKARYNPELDLPCPAIVRATEEAAQMDFNDDPGDFQADPPEEPEELAKLLKWATTIEQFIKTVKGHAQRLAFSGTPIPGYKIVRGKSAGRKFIEMRQETDKDGNPVFTTNEHGEQVPSMVPVTEDWLVSQIVKTYGAEEVKLFNPKTLRTAPQIEKAVPKELRKAYSETLLWAPPGKLTLALETDPREPEDPPNSAQDDFADDEGSEVPE